MRTLVMIAGITGAGKTVAGMELSAYLGWPLVETDGVLYRMAQWSGNEKPERLCWDHYLSEIENGEELKQKAYEEILNVEGDFVIEGFNLGYKKDRAIISGIIGEHRRAFFYLNPPMEKWKEHCLKKGYEEFEGKGNWDKWQAAFERPDDCWEVPDKAWLMAPYNVYQRKGLTDIKWSQLKMPRRLDGETILDLGCNDGWIGRGCRERGASAIVGADNNWRNLLEAKTFYNQTILADLNEWTPAVKFDRVFCLAMLHYIKDKEKFIRRISPFANEFILEMPVAEGSGRGMEDYHGLLIPTRMLLMDWLGDSFSKVENVGRAAAPDRSRREIFKCSN